MRQGIAFKTTAAWLLITMVPGIRMRAEVPAAKATPARPLAKVRVAADGRGFETAPGRTFAPVGVNYFRPGTGWAPKVWQTFDPEATRRDFQVMRGLGVNCVRVFLTLGSFYAQPGRLGPEALAKFDRFLEIAERHGIYVHPTGPDHWEGLPAWARGDRIARESFLAAMETFWRLFARRYRGRPVIFAYDLLNEPSVPWTAADLRPKWTAWLKDQYGSLERIKEAWPVADLPQRIEQVTIPPPEQAITPQQRLDYQHFRESVADEWTRRQAAAIKEVDPQALVTVGMIQWSVPTLLPRADVYSAFRPQRQARFLDFLSVHFYPLDGGAYGYEGRETELRNLAYLESVVLEVARAGKPVVIGEFGWYGGGKPRFNRGRPPAATEQQQAQWCRRVMETTAPLACGWLNWGLYDHPEARDVTELTGLLTSDGRLKAWGRQFQAVAETYRRHRRPPDGLPDRPTIDWDRCITDVRAGHAFREAYQKAFRSDHRD